MSTGTGHDVVLYTLSDLFDGLGLSAGVWGGGGDMSQVFGRVGAVVCAATATVATVATLVVPVRGDAVDGRYASVAAGWTVPKVLGTTPANFGYTSLVASPNGDLTVLWTKPHGMVSRTLRAGGRWTSPSPLRGSGEAQRLGSDARGNLTALFTAQDQGVVMAATKRRGGPWSAPQRISSIPRRGGCRVHPFFQSLAVSPRGSAVAAWVMISEDCVVREPVEVSYRPPGGHWRHWLVLAYGSSVEGVAFSPRGRPMVLLSGKTLRVLWRTSRGWQQAGDAVAGRVEGAGLAVGPHGHLVVVMERHVRTGGVASHQILGSRWVGGHWTVPVEIAQETTPGSGGLAVGVDAFGTATVLWTSEAVRVARWRVAHTPSSPRTLLAHDGWAPLLRVAGGGAATVLVERVTDGWKTRLVAFSRGAHGSWSQAEAVSRRRLVSTYVSEALDISYHGRAFVSWADNGDAGPTAVRLASHR
ncbi:MAG: hypothetical protein WAV00_15025 [Nocardioides sp.]